jgi:DNA-binding MarR family transcriptional regulator
VGCDPDAETVAAALHVSVGLLRWRLRQLQLEGDLSLPERSALTRLYRGGPATPSELARREQITPQGMGATLAALEGRGLVARSSDPEDGRRAVMSLTETGQQALADRRNTRTEQLAQALSDGFTRQELKILLAAAPLIERLAESL